MKVACFILCCAILTSYSVVSGDLRDFMKNIGNAAKKDISDTMNAFNFNNENRIIFKESKEDKRDFSAARTETNQVKEANVEKEEAKVETSTLSATTTVNPAAKSNSTTGKDGRENFAAACSTGFKRTADGRCMPTY